jgi:glycosyltransferase involved in cell wall biosynthesis
MVIFARTIPATARRVGARWMLDRGSDDRVSERPSLDDSLTGFRLVTLCGSAGSKHDSMRDTQDLLEPAFAARGIDVRPVDLGDWSLLAVPKLLRAIAEQKPDGILFQYPTGAFGHSLGPVALGLVQQSAPAVVMLHEFVVAHPLRKAAVGALLLRATRVGLTAEREEKYLTRAFPWLRGRTRFIPLVSNIPRRPWSPEGVTIVYFGQQRPNKGIEEFLAIKPRIAERFPDARFEIIGATIPGREDYSNKLVEEAGKLGIVVRSSLSMDEVSDHLSKATIALLPFPGGASMRRSSMLAAAVCGTPIVTTTGEDTPASLYEYLERAETKDDLTQACIASLSDPSLLDARHRSSMRLGSSIGLDATVDAYCAVFRELTKGREHHERG